MEPNKRPRRQTIGPRGTRRQTIGPRGTRRQTIKPRGTPRRIRVDSKDAPAPAGRRQNSGTKQVAERTESVVLVPAVEVEGAAAFSLTVFRSPTIEPFPVELVGHLPGGIGGTEIILGRATGPILDSLGGVPAGASGSPVFVDGKLIGAIASTFGNDHSLVGITPWAAMSALGDGGHSAPAATAGTGASSRARANYSMLRPIAVGFRSAAALQQLARRLDIAVDELGRAPDGVPDQIVDQLSAWTGNRFPHPTPSRYSGSTHGRHFRPTPSHTLAGPPANDDPARRPGPRVAPGSPLGAAALTGDLQFGYIGTATAVRDHDIFGFGHPAFYLGPVATALTAPTIVTVAHGPAPFKVGALGPVIGTTLWDGGAGIRGRLGRRPNMMALSFFVTDLNRQCTVRLRCQASEDPGWLAFFVAMGTTESLARASDRTGPGAARWQWTIRTSAASPPLILPGEGYSPYDIAGTVAAAVADPLDELFQQGIIPTSISLTATLGRIRVRSCEQRMTGGG